MSEPRLLEPESPKTEAASDARKLAVSGTFWTMLGYGGSMVLRFGSNMALAYLLFPSAFGVMTKVNIFMMALEMFSDLGIWRGVVQNKRGDEPAYLDTAFTIQVIRGISLWLITCAVAWPYAAFYENSALIAYLIVGGLLVLFRGFESTGLLLLRRRVELKKIAMFNLCGQSFQVFTMIVLASVHPSVWALVIGGVAGSFYKMVASHVCFNDHRSRMRWNRDAGRELLCFGKWIFFSSIVTFLASSSDRLILGKVISEAELGVYSFAFAYTSMAVMVAGRLANTVLFPIISRFQEDPRTVMDMFLKARGVFLSAAGGLCAAIVLGAPVFFEVIFPDEYALAGSHSQWLSMLTWAGIIVLGIDLVPLSLGNARVQFFGNLIRSGGIALAVTGFYMAEIPGLVTGLTVTVVLAFLYFVSRLPNGRWKVIRQSASHTALLGAYAALGLLTIDACEGKWGTVAGYAVAVGFSLGALGNSARTVWMKARN